MCSKYAVCRFAAARMHTRCEDQDAYEASAGAAAANLVEQNIFRLEAAVADGVHVHELEP